MLFGLAQRYRRGMDQDMPDQRAPEQVTFDRPEVVAEVRSAFERYERALADGDVAVMTELFWDDPRCVRFGIADRQQGADEIEAWRHTHPSVPPGRTLRDTRVLAVDDRTAVVTTLISYPDRAIEGRQSQTWVRLPEGWRVVEAHVSELPLGA
ncbi:oxalurate catabolism protein HpxZ [Pseudonocardia xinjiangensis]